MKSVVSFFKATILGGVIFLVPVVGLVYVLAKALQLSRKLAEPISDIVPLNSVIGVAVADIIALTVIVLLCFAAGMLARNSLASAVVREAEARFLWKMPGYGIVKGLTDSLGDVEDGSMKPVLARLDDASQLAFEVERLSDGRVVVYVPGSPEPWSGAVLIMTEDRVEALSVGMVGAVQNLRARGQGTAALLERAA